MKTFVLEHNIAVIPPDWHSQMLTLNVLSHALCLSLECFALTLAEGCQLPV